MEEERKTSRTRDDSHGSKNLPSSAAWVALHPSLLWAAHHPSKPEPQQCPHSPAHGASVGRHSMESSWQADGAGGCRGAAREQQHSAQHRCQTLMGFPGLTGVSSSRSWLSRLFLPLTRANGKRSPHQPSLLWAVSCKIQDSRRTSWPQAGTWWWDAEGMCNCHLRHTDCRARKWGQDRGDVERRETDPR